MKQRISNVAVSFHKAVANKGICALFAKRDRDGIQPATKFCSQDAQSDVPLPYGVGVRG